MSKEQNLRKYLTHVLTVSSDKSPRLLEALVKNAKQFAKDNSQESYIQIVRAQLNKNKGKKVKELIRYIYIFDSLVKQAKSYRQQIAQVIGQIFVLLFSVFFENNFQSEVQDLKMVRKSWPTLLPDDVLNNIQKQVLSKFNYNLDKGFSKKKIDQLTAYYSTKMKLSPDVYIKYLPSIENVKPTNNYMNNNIEQFPPQDEQPIVKRRKLMPQYGSAIQNNQISSVPANPYTPPLQSMAYQPPNYQTHNYQTQQNHMYQQQQHPIQYQPMPIQPVQPQQHMQMNTSYYYQNNMQQMGGYNNYYNNQSIYGNTTNNMNNGMMNNINNHINNGIHQINNGMNNNITMNMNDYYKMGGYYDPRMQAESKVRQRQETSKPKQIANNKYKELLSFGRYRCPCCGMVSNRRDYFDMHLKSHFQQSKKSYQSLKKQNPIVRQTALSLKEWMPSKNKDDQNKYFVQINKYPQNTCKLCSGTFQSAWDSLLEVWVYKNVVLVELDNSQHCSMHLPCFETINQKK